MNFLDISRWSSATWHLPGLLNQHKKSPMQLPIFFSRSRTTSDDQPRFAMSACKVAAEKLPILSPAREPSRINVFIVPPL